MKKSSILILATALVIGLATPALADSADNAPPALTATAVCNGKWVNVTVNAPDSAIIVAKRPTGNWVAYGNKFVPDTGGSNAAGDYGIILALEQWDTTQTPHIVLAAGSVNTPYCGVKVVCVPLNDERHTTCTRPPVPTTPPTTLVTQKPEPLYTAPLKLVTVVEQEAYDVWAAIVGSVSINL